MEKGKYRKHGVFFNQKGDQKNDLQSIFNSITYNVDEIVSSIVFFTVSLDKPQVRVQFESANFSEELEIKTKYWDILGRCYSVQPKDHIIKLGIRSLEILTRMEVYIYFGYPGQFMHPDTKSKVLILLEICKLNAMFA